MKSYLIGLFPFSQIPKNYPFINTMIRLVKSELPECKFIQFSKTPVDLIPDVDELKFNLSLDEICYEIQKMDLWIGVDNFAQHLLKGLKKGVVIFGKSDPLIFGYSENINLLKDRKYLRKNQFDFWFNEELDIDCWVEPDTIKDIIVKELRGN